MEISLLSREIPSKFEAEQGRGFKIHYSRGVTKVTHGIGSQYMPFEYHIPLMRSLLLGTNHEWVGSTHLIWNEAKLKQLRTNCTTVPLIPVPRKSSTGETYPLR